MKKIGLLFLMFILILCLSIIFMYNQWKSYNPNLASMMWTDNFKTLYLVSTIQEGQYSIIIDFSYVKSELSQFSQSKIDSLKNYNLEHDTIKVYFNGGSWSRSKKLPILKNDSVLFPENFCIKIYTEDNTKLLREVDFQEFEQLAEADYMSPTKNFLTAKEWTLTIDSTLLGLDKLKTDSIK